MPTTGDALRFPSTIGTGSPLGLACCTFGIVPVDASRPDAAGMAIMSHEGEAPAACGEGPRHTGGGCPTMPRRTAGGADAREPGRGGGGIRSLSKASRRLSVLFAMVVSGGGERGKRGG
jgi:hypothetical protein